MKRLPDVWQAETQPTFAGPVLIDTHVWIWYLDGVTDRLPPAAIDFLRRCGEQSGLRICDISVWEIGNKVAKGKLALSPSVSAWIERAVRSPGFAFLPLERSVLLASTQLPGTVHGDPADRMLIAAAALAGIPLVTADRLIVEYAAQQGGLSVCDVRS